MDMNFRGVCEDALSSMIGAPDDEVGKYRLRNLRAYNAEPVGLFAPPDIEDRSSLVATDARDTVNWMKPGLMKTFLGTDNAVEFTATRQDKEAEAKLITEYVNYVFRTKNPGFTIMDQWLTDALVEKVGFVKVWYDWENKDNREDYAGLTEEQVQSLSMDPDVEIIGDPQPVDPVEMPQPPMMQGQPPQPPVPPLPLYSVSIKRTERVGKVCIVPCPPEEVRISRRARYGDPVDMVAHVFQKPRYELQDMGYDMEDVSGGVDMTMTLNEETYARQSTRIDYSAGSADRSMQLFDCVELYIRYDYDDDRVTEWRKVFKIGGEWFENEKVDDHPFVWICPIPRPHTFFGECPVDYAIAPQLLHTTMIRAAVDGAVLSVNPRTEVMEGQVNYEDLVDSSPGGIVRVKQMGMTREIVIPDVSEAAYKLIEYSKEWKEDATGFTRYSQGTDSNSLNKTATGVSIITQKADMRMELISRHVAEGMKDLFRKTLKLIIEHQDVAEMVKVAGQWVNIDPSEWTDQHELSINVGLGTGDRQGQQQKAQLLIQNVMGLMQTGVTNPQNLQAAEKLFMQSLDLPQPELYYQAGQLPQQPPQPNPDQIKAQQAQQAQQQDMQHAAMMASATHDAEQMRLDREERLQMAKMDADFRFRMQEMQAKNDLEWRKAQLASQTSIEVASIGAQAQALKSDAELQRATTVARTKAVAELNGQLIDHRHDALMAGAEHDAGMQRVEHAASIAPEPTDE